MLGHPHRPDFHHRQVYMTAGPAIKSKFGVYFTENIMMIECYVSVLIQEMLSRSLEEGEMDGLVTGFLLARQACLEGLHVFPAYQDWFQVSMLHCGILVGTAIIIVLHDKLRLL